MRPSILIAPDSQHHPPRPVFPIDQKIKDQISQALDVLAKVSPTNNQISTYNKIIIEHLQQVKTLNVLFALLLNSEGEHIRCSLIINFISYYLKSQVRYGMTQVRHDKRQVYQKIKSMFFCFTLSDRHKKMLQTSFSDYLSTLSPQFMKMRRQLCQQIVDFYTNHENPSLIDIGNSLYLIESVLTSSLQTQSLRLLEEKLLLNFITLSLRLIRDLQQIIINTIIFTEQQKQKIVWVMKIQKITSLLFLHAKPEKLYLLKFNTITSNQFAQLMIISLRVSINNLQFMLNQKQCKQYAIINQIKQISLGMMKDALTLLIRSKKDLSNPKFIPIIQTIKIYLSDIVPKLANQVKQFPTTEVHSQNIFRDALWVLSKIVQIPCLLTELTQNRDLILYNICLPCFITTPKDKELLAEDYCDKKQRVIDHNNIVNPHQAAAQLMQAYFDHIYGSIPNVATSLINLMEFQLTANPKYFQQIPSILTQSHFFTRFTHYQQIQASLGVIALLSYQADVRDDIPIAFEAFIVRRQQFFSRNDLPPEVITSFFHTCAYYLSNFYSMILDGKANPDYHRALIFHSLELLKLSYNPNTRNYIDNNAKKIGIQAIDYISNVLIQQNLFEAVFPAQNLNSTGYFSTLISNVCQFLSSAFNVSLLENVLIDFVTKFIAKHYKENSQVSTLPALLRNQLSTLIVQHIVGIFKPNIKNETLAKQKLLQLYQLCILTSQNPTTLLLIGNNLFNHIVEIEYMYIDEGLDVIQVYLARVSKQQLKIPIELGETIIKYIIKSTKVCDNEKLQYQIFDIVMNLTLMKLYQQQLILNLLQIFEERLEQKDTDEQAQIVMQKILYLIMQIAFSNFNLVFAGTWLKILQRMINYMKVYYVSRGTTTIGKATCICLCCYLEDPQGVESFLGSRMEGLWDCVLDDQQKYSSVTEKKILCILLEKLIIQFHGRVNIKDKFSEILKTICAVVYYNYEKNQMEWEDDYYEDESMEEEEDEEKEKKGRDDQRNQKWRPKLNTIRENPFLSNLPDQRITLREICVNLNETNHKNFTSFVNNLPLGLQNLVKNKIMMYRSNGDTTNKKKLRTILKIKKLDQQFNS